jgi:hypothetical protein
MDVEEEGTVAGIIPETSRVVITAVYNRPDGVNKCTALVQCVQRNRSPETDLVWHERKVSYCYSRLLKIKYWLEYITRDADRARTRKFQGSLHLFVRTGGVGANVIYQY